MSAIYLLGVTAVMFLVASNVILYGMLAILLILLVGSAMSRSPVQPVPKAPECLDPAILSPLPKELRLRMRRYLCGRALPAEIQENYFAEVKQRHDEGMRRIRSAS